MRMFSRETVCAEVQPDTQPEISGPRWRRLIQRRKTKRRLRPQEPAMPNPLNRARTRPSRFRGCAQQRRAAGISLPGPSTSGRELAGPSAPSGVTLSHLPEQPQEAYYLEQLRTHRRGVPKKRCKDCFHEDLGASKRSDITRWLKANNLALEGTYGGQAKQHRWTCENDHTFEASYANLHQKDTPCTRCALAVIEDARGVTLGHSLGRPLRPRHCPRLAVRRVRRPTFKHVPRQHGPENQALRQMLNPKKGW